MTILKRIKRDFNPLRFASGRELWHLGRKGSTKMLLKTTSLVVIGAFLFNTVSIDLALGQTKGAAILTGARISTVSLSPSQRLHPRGASGVLRPMARAEKKNEETKVNRLISRMKNDPNEFRRAAAAKDLGRLFKTRPTANKLLIQRIALALLAKVKERSEEAEVVKTAAAFAIGELVAVYPLGEDFEQNLVFALIKRGLEHSVKKELIRAISKAKQPSSALRSKAATIFVTAVFKEGDDYDEMCKLGAEAVGNLGFIEEGNAINISRRAWELLRDIAMWGSYTYPVDTNSFNGTAETQTRFFSSVVKIEAIAQMTNLVSKATEAMLRQIDSTGRVPTVTTSDDPERVSPLTALFDHLGELFSILGAGDEDHYSTDATVRFKTAQNLQVVSRLIISLLSKMQSVHPASPRYETQITGLKKRLIQDVELCLYGDGKKKRRADPEVALVILGILEELGDSQTVNMQRLLNFIFISDDNRVSLRTAEVILTIGDPETKRSLQQLPASMKGASSLQLMLEQLIIVSQNILRPVARAERSEWQIDKIHFEKETNGKKEEITDITIMFDDGTIIILEKNNRATLERNPRGHSPDAILAHLSKNADIRVSTRATSILAALNKYKSEQAVNANQMSDDFKRTIDVVTRLIGEIKDLLETARGIDGEEFNSALAPYIALYPEERRSSEERANLLRELHVGYLDVVLELLTLIEQYENTLKDEDSDTNNYHTINILLAHISEQASIFESNFKWIPTINGLLKKIDVLKDNLTALVSYKKNHIKFLNGVSIEIESQI